MALMQTTSGGLAPTMKMFYDRVLLERALPVLLHDKFAQKKRIPKGNGTEIEFRKFNGLATATTPLVEGVPPTLKDVSMSKFTATVAQYGDAVGFTDVVSTTTFDPVLTETTAVLGEQAGETIDELIRDVLNAGTVVMFSSLASASANRAAVSTGDTINIADLRKAVRTLKIARAKKIDGWYHAIIHPRVAHDLQGLSEWVTANQYAGANRIFDGSLGTLYGVKFWETDKAKVFSGPANGNLGGGEGGIDVYSTLFFGSNAYGVVDLDGHSLQSFYKPLGSAGTADPVNQQQSMGWKVMFTTVRLVEQYMLRYECAVTA